MSLQLVSRSPDLKRLRDEGYDIEIRANYLLVHHVPYVTAAKEVAYGTLVSELSTGGDRTIRPGDHVVSFAGGIPCDIHGEQLTKVINGIGVVNLAAEIQAECTLSSKPQVGYYEDYYQKVISYVNMISGAARAIDPSATARTYPVVRTDAEESVFRYLDSASSRAGISGIAGKLASLKVAIVGLGGTGSYILDLVAKTPVAEIHLFDADYLYTHNAFRAPGAVTAEEMDPAPTKVEHYQKRYDAMHRSIHAHPIHVDGSNVDELHDMDFVFLSMDAGPSKKAIITSLETVGLPYIDCGMGVYRVGDSLGGIVRVTASTADRRAHVWEHQRVSFADEEDDEYSHNIQLADLNMLNAALAVVKWKKLYGIYADSEHELFMAYTLGANQLLNEDQAG